MREALQDDDAAAFAANVTIRSGIERLAAPRGRQHPRPPQRGGQIGRQDEIDAADEREIAFPGAEALHGQV